MLQHSHPFVLVTRPQPQADHLADILRKEGARVLIEPLLEIIDIPHRNLNFQSIQAIFLTSINGVKSLAKASDVRHIPIFAVGEATAQMAQDAGFQTIFTAGGDAISLMSLIKETLSPHDGGLWHGRGADISHDIAADLSGYGFEVKSEILYKAQSIKRLSPETSHHLRVGDVQSALFFSPRTALTFITLMQKMGLEQGVRGCVAYALSSKVAKALETVNWARVVISKQPSLSALLIAWRGCLGIDTRNKG